ILERTASAIFGRMTEAHPTFAYTNTFILQASLDAGGLPPGDAFSITGRIYWPWPSSLHQNLLFSFCAAKRFHATINLIGLLDRYFSRKFWYLHFLYLRS